MVWRGFRRRTCKTGGEHWSRNHKVVHTDRKLQKLKCSLIFVVKHELFCLSISESQKKKSNQDDSDEDDDDDDEAGPSTQQGASVQAQASYASPMAQLGIPPVAGAHGMHPGGYQGKG